ncbi:DUF759 family protein [Borrelia crocidurae]|nr:DUF759 family protein [Borrelia crocidurae]
MKKLEKKPFMHSFMPSHDLRKIEYKQIKAKERDEKKLTTFKKKVERFRLTETKRLMKQGYSFEKARKKAFMHSLTKDINSQKSEYESLKETKKQQTLQSKVFWGTFLGNMASSGSQKFAGGIVNFVWKAMSKKSDEDRMKKRVGYSYTDEEYANINSMLSKKVGFKLASERLDFLNKTSSFQSIIKNIGIYDGGQSMNTALELASDLVSRNLTDSNEQSAQITESALKGDFTPLYEIMRDIKGKGFKSKYSDRSLDLLQGDLINNPLARLDLLKMIHSDIKDNTTAGYASNFDAIKEDVKSIMDEIEDGISIASKPLVDIMKELINFIKDPATKITEWTTKVGTKATSSMSVMLSTVTSKLKSTFATIMKKISFGWIDLEKEK